MFCFVFNSVYLKKSRQTKRTFCDNFGAFFFFAGYNPTLIQRSITHIHIILIFICFSIHPTRLFVCIYVFVLVYHIPVLYLSFNVLSKGFSNSTQNPKPTLQKHCILTFSQQTNEFVTSQRFDNNNKVYLKNNVTKYP